MAPSPWPMTPSPTTPMTYNLWPVTSGRHRSGWWHAAKIDRLQPWHTGRILLSSAQAQVLRRHAGEVPAAQQTVRVQRSPAARGTCLRLLRRRGRDRVRLRRKVQDSGKSVSHKTFAGRIKLFTEKLNYHPIGIDDEFRQWCMVSWYSACQIYRKLWLTKVFQMQTHRFYAYS